MKTIDVPGVGAVDFPEEMSDEDIVTAIEKEILPQVEAQAATRKETEHYWSGSDRDGGADKPGYLSNLVRGAGERVLGLTGGALRTVGQLAEEGGDWLERHVPLGTLDHPFTPMTEEQIQQNTVPLPDWGNKLAGTDLGYEPRTTWQDVKDNWANVVPFAVEQGVTSIPDAAAAVFAPGAYAAARTGEIAQTRAENDGRESATVDDLMRAAPSAAASALLERFGAHGMMGLGDDAIRAFSQLPGAMGKAAVKEGATEFGQEVSDYLGETLGTNKGSTVGEALERGLAGAVGGAPFGGGVRGLTGAVQVWAQNRGVEPTQENLETAAKAGDTQAFEILKASGVMSDEQLANLSPEAAERFAARYQGRRAAEEDPVLAAQRTQAAVENRDLEGGDTLPNQQSNRMTDQGGIRREGILKTYDIATQQVDAAIEAGQIKPEQREAAIRERAVGLMPELDQRAQADARTVAAARARINEILTTPASAHTPELATEYLELNNLVHQSERKSVIQLGRTRAYDKQTSGSTEDAGLRQAVDTYGRQRLLPSPASAGRSMSDEQVAYAQAVARRTQEEAARNQAPLTEILDNKTEGATLPPAPGTAYGSENRLPQTRDQLVEQDRAEQAMRLAQHLATKAGPTIRDVQAGGRPEGGVESQQTIFLDQGYPVRILEDRTVKGPNGAAIRIAKVRRYDPRTNQDDTGQDGQPVEYEVPADHLTTGRYARDDDTLSPRRAQQFEEEAKTPVVGPYKDANGKTVKPKAAGTRADELQGLPRQTYRTTPPDPTVAGAEGPTTELPGGGPVPRSPRPEQGSGPGFDKGSGGRGANARGGTTGEEWARQEAKRRERMKEQAERGETQDEQGQQTDWGKARSKYEGQKTGYSGKPKGVDEDGWPHVDEDGYILSDKGGPIRFETQEAMKKRLIELRKAHPDAGIVNVPHPGPMRKTGMGSAESYWTLQATRPKPAKAQAEQPQQEQAAPEQPAYAGPQRTLPGPAPTPDPAPEAPRNDTVSTPEQRQNDSETTPVRNPEQLVASVEKGLRDRQVKPNPKAISRHFEVSEAAAANALAAIAGRGDKVIRQVKPNRKELEKMRKGEGDAPKAPRYRLTPQFDEDMSLLEFLMSKGGLAANGDLTAMDARRKSHPRYGNLVRKQGGGGMSLDEARELAETEGFIGQGTDDYNTTTERDLLEAIDDELRGNRVKAERTGSGSERDQMEARARELGIEVNPDWNDAELMVEIGEADAIANADNPTVEAADHLREVVDAMLVEMGIVPDTYAADFDIPFGDKDAGSDQGAGEVGTEAESAAEAAVDGAGRQAPDVRSGDRAAETRAGNAEETGRERREPRVEKTDQGDQYVLPGEVGDLSGAETLKGKGPQKRADEGLFAKKAEPEPEQIDLEDAIAAAKAEPKATTTEERIAALKAPVPAATGELARQIAELTADLPVNDTLLTLKTGVTKDGTLMVSLRDEAGDRVAYLTMSREEGADGKPEFNIDYVDNELGEPGLGTWLYKRAALEAIRRGADGLLVGGIASDLAEGAHGRLKRDGWIGRELDVKSGDNLLVAPPKAKQTAQAEPEAEAKPDVPAKGTHRVVDGIDVVATGHPDHPWAGGRLIEKGANEGWQPDSLTQGKTPEEAAANVVAKKQRDDADRTKHTDATNRWNAAVEAAKSGEMPGAALLKGATRYGDGKVSTGDAKAFLRDMGLTAKQTNKVVDQTTELDVTSGGARLYDLARIVRTGQNVLDVAEVVNKTAAPKAETKPKSKKPPKRKERAALLSRLFGRDPKVELTAEQETADEAAWKERLEQIAPRAETVADIERILDENVERGILNKGTAKGISDILGRMPTEGLKGIRLMIQDRMTAEERAILGTAKGVSGEYFTLNDDPDTRVLTVLGENGSKDAVETFVHENAHVMFGAISEPDKALARQIYDRLPISRQAMHTVGYDKDTRFEEWFAESAVDYYTAGLKTDGPRAGTLHMLGGLMQRLFKRVIDLFSGERAQIDALFSGLGTSLGSPGPVSVEGITRRERRGVSTLAILSNPIGAITGDWKAWRSGFQELHRDVTETWKSPRPNRQNAAAGLARWWFYSADGEYRAAIGKFNSPTLNLLADTFHAQAGSSHGLDRKLASKLGMKLASNATFDEATTRKTSVELQQLDRTLRDFRKDPAAMDRIVDLVQNPARRRSDPESKAASEIARQLASLHKYMVDAGVDLGTVKSGYFPREVDSSAVLKDPTGFVDAAAKAYRASGLGTKEAEAAANAWLTNVLYGGVGSPLNERKGNTPSFVQSRVLSKQADEILKNYYQRDVDLVLGSYISRAAKRAEIARRFGDGFKNWEAIEKQIRAEDPAAAGMLGHLQSYAATAAGVRHDSVSSLIRQGSSLVRTVTSVSLLEKSTLTSLAEAIMPALRTGSAKDFLPAITKTLHEFVRELRHMPPTVAAELAADIGAIAGSGTNSIMAARFAGGDPLGRGQARVLSKYFRRIGLEQWTDATRIAATERGAVFIRRLAKDIAGNGLNPKSARIYMEEMGIQKDQLDAFVTYVNGFGDTLPTASDLDKGGEMGAAYRVSLLRFVDQTILRPTSTTRPRWASHPVGAVLFQLQAFSYAFSKNVLLRDLRLAKTALTEKDMGLVDRILLAAPLMMMLPALAMVQAIIGEMRDWLLMDPERYKAQTRTAKIEKAISRAGLTGALDPYVQMLSGARYQKDPLSALTGPFFGIFGSGLGALQQYIGNNSPNTNAAERKATEALYDVLIEPLVNIALGYSPASPLATVITTGLIPRLRDDFVDSIAGERIGHKQPKIFGVSELLAGKQFEKKSGSWAAGG